MLWRGVPAGMTSALLVEAPDGTRIFTVYLMHGYGSRVHLHRRRTLAGGCVEAIAWPRVPAPSLP
jgi:hypothetical protein